MYYHNFFLKKDKPVSRSFPSVVIGAQMDTLTCISSSRVVPRWRVDVRLSLFAVRPRPGSRQQGGGNRRTLQMHNAEVSPKKLHMHFLHIFWLIPSVKLTELQAISPISSFYFNFRNFPEKKFSNAKQKTSFWEEPLFWSSSLFRREIWKYLL